MSVTVLLAIVNPIQFTGYEHTQVISLLIILALVSSIVWVLVLVSIIVRQVALLAARLFRHRLKVIYNRERVKHEL